MGVLDGVTVLDLSWGISGPAATMLLADNGADVTRIERPQGDPFDGYLDYKTYNRGKRSAVLDLKDPADRDRFLALARRADVVVESFSPGVTASLGIDYETLKQQNERLVYCTVSAYGKDSTDGNRPGIDQLVAARSGFQWEVRSWPGTPKQSEAGEEEIDPSLAPNEQRWYINRRGPAFIGTAAPSISASYLATLGISAALRAREITGRGQHVETSLLQGIIGYQLAFWQRTQNQNPMAMAGHTAGPSISLLCNWVIFRCADGWVNMWTGDLEWAKAAAAGDTLVQPDLEELLEKRKAAMAAGRNPMMGGMGDRLQATLDAQPYFLKFPVSEWEKLAHDAMAPLQPVRSPEAALTDPALVAEGCVVDVEDPDLGTLRQPGLLYRLTKTPGKVGTRVPRRGEHTDEVRAEADGGGAAAGGPAGGQPLSAPLAGVRALDFGLAVAGPWGGELLSQLGADVIKIDPERQKFWLGNPMAMGVNRSKRHVLLDMKNPDGAKAVHELVKKSDIVLMNLRPQAAKKLGLDYESLRQINPRIIVCLQRGNDLSRAHLPSNDQQGNALAGTEWEEGGVARGGKPYFSGGTGGDLGNGALSAIAMVQALYHRDRTGEGQEIDSSIVYAGLFANSRIYSDPQGTRYDRPTVDADLYGMTALYRLYECREGWLCVAALSDDHWQKLTAVMPALAADARFASAASRAQHDKDLVAELEQQFLSDSADAWFARLDAAGVPCEVSRAVSPDDVFSNEDYVRRGLVATFEGHPQHGTVEMFGKLIDFSDTPAVTNGPPPVAGQHSREILKEVIGYTDAQVDALVESGAILES